MHDVNWSIFSFQLTPQSIWVPLALLNRRDMPYLSCQDSMDLNKANVAGRTQCFVSSYGNTNSQGSRQPMVGNPLFVSQEENAIVAALSDSHPQSDTSELPVRFKRHSERIWQCVLMGNNTRCLHPVTSIISDRIGLLCLSKEWTTTFIVDSNLFIILLILYISSVRSWL